MRANQERKSVIVALAAVGIVGPLVFVLLVGLQGWVRPEYSHLTMPVSALAAGPSGWIQNMNFMVLGFLLIAHAVGVHVGVQPHRRGVLGPTLLAVSGLGIVGAGVFPATDPTGAFSPAQPLHGGMSVVAFLAAGGGMIALSRRVRHDRDWDGWSRSVLAFGIGTLLMLVVFGVLARPPGAPLHDWMGLVQRALIGVWLGGIVMVSLGLLRGTRDRTAVPAMRQPEP